MLLKWGPQSQLAAHVRETIWLQKSDIREEGFSQDTSFTLKHPLPIARPKGALPALFAELCRDDRDLPGRCSFLPPCK